MKKSFFTLFIFAAISCAFYIENLDVTIDIQADGSILVKEQFDVAFGFEQWHGLERIIPYKYRRDGSNYNLRIKVLSAMDEQYDDYQISKKHQGRNLLLRLGDPDVYISGDKTYIIQYKVNRALNFFDDRAELYWNVTGHEWRIPINTVNTAISLPASFPQHKVLYTCYTGQEGSTRSDCTQEQDESGTIHINSEMINPGNGLTFVVSFPASSIVKPTKMRKISWFLTDNLLVLLALLMPFLIIFIMYRLWNLKGKDPIDIHSGIVRYSPPEELLPAQAGSLYDETVDMRDITSTIIDLAVRGYLRIEELETLQILFFKKVDYRLVQTASFEDLTNYEITLLTGLFKEGIVSNKSKNFKSVLVSELKHKFYTEIRGIRKAIMQSLVNKGCFDVLPSTISNKYFSLGVAVAGGGVTVGLFSQSVLFILSSILSGTIIIIFSKLMPRKTRKGANLARQILGFQEFVERVEKDRIEKMAKEDPTIFDRLLPYAMALGAEDHWATAFEGIYREAPSWYHGTNMSGTFHTALFVNNLGNAMNTMSKSMSSMPRGSAGSGGSGFSGGSSGGGFGGGGGGGW